MNYYPFHIGDYASATRHLSWDEDMAYRRLLDLYYSTEKPLPTELRAVFRLTLASTEVQRDAVEAVLHEFFVRTDDGWINGRADTEIDAMREKQKKQREKANKRWHKPDEERGNALAMPQHEEAKAAASKKDADAMPPTPTPTPTPTPDIDMAKTASPVLPIAKQVEDCPHQSIIDLYHELLPAARQVREWTPARQQVLKARWREKPTRQSLDWWRRFFAYVAESDFLMGRVHTPGRKPFELSLDWLVKSENMAKVIEGAYQNEKVAA